MATLYRPVIIRYRDKSGRTVKKDTPGAKKCRERSKTFRGRYVDATGKTKTVSLFDDREASEAKLATIVQEERDIKAGIRRRDPFRKHRETPLLCPECAGTGCSRGKKSQAACEPNHLDAYIEHLAARDDTAKHGKLSKTRLREVIDGCGFVLLEDLNAGRVAVWLKNRRSTGTSPATSNHYVTAIKSFGNWLLLDCRWPENPFGHLAKVNARVDVRVVRRALSQEELAALVEAAEHGEPFRDLSGSDKAILYLMAAFTVLRVSELASLTTASLDFRASPPTLTVEASCSKHRREDVLPLHPELALRLRIWLQEQERRTLDGGVIPFNAADGPEPLFPGTWPDRAAKMLRRDLEAARVKWLDQAATDEEREERERSDYLNYETDDGRADFHALRHTFISNLAASGVHPKLAKELARHSTISLTLDRYTHVGLVDMNAALESLPGIPETPEAQRARCMATGTGPKNVAPDVALGIGNIRSLQELSRETAAASAMTDDSRNVGSQEDLREVLQVPEKWWGGDLNPRPAGYESAALTN